MRNFQFIVVRNRGLCLKKLAQHFKPDARLNPSARWSLIFEGRKKKEKHTLSLQLINEDISVNLGSNTVPSLLRDCTRIRFSVVVIYRSCIVSRPTSFIVDTKGFVAKLLGLLLAVLNHSFSTGHTPDIFIESLGQNCRGTV